MERAPTFADPHNAKAQILNYCRRKGALVAGVAKSPKSSIASRHRGIGRAISCRG